MAGKTKGRRREGRKAEEIRKTKNVEKGEAGNKRKEERSYPLEEGKRLGV